MSIPECPTFTTGCYAVAEPVGPLRTPSRADRTVDGEKPAGRGVSQSLDAGAIMESFSKVGLICGVVRPAPDENDAVVAAVERADLVVIDWQLHHDDGERALRLIDSILDGDQGQRLRLIAVYTGESDIGGIGGRINEKLRNRYDLENGTKDHSVTLSCGHCRIVIYAKQDTPLIPELKNRSVSETVLPGRLIDDFARMTAGLLPSIALVALTAVRENAHRVLDKFDGGLDAAFLTHRACLPVPDDSEQHMVAQIASELRAIMEAKVDRKSPAGMEAIESWIEKFKGSGNIEFEGGPVSRQDVLNMLDRGVGTPNVFSKPNGLSKSKAHSRLTAGFARDEDGRPEELDLRLAWMTCFRAIDPPDRKLWLGTAVRRCGKSDSEEFLLCMRPRCDSVRMTETGSFLFLPLIKPNPKQRTFQLVVRSSSNGPKYCRVSLCTYMSQWEILKFDPDPTAKAVVAQEESAGYVFTDVGGNRYEWIGELKTEVAHSVGQTLSSTLSRIALDRSEWLRRSEGSG